MIVETILAAGMAVGTGGERLDQMPLLCSVQELRENPDGYHWPLDRIEGFVDEAEVIVRAVALGVEEQAEPWSEVGFGVTEVVRGEVDEEKLVFQGQLVDRDDFNEGEVPYQIVRPAGQRGDCFARQYRAGAEYLFFLWEQDGSLTPYGPPLAPTNEQVRGRDDPWVAWVRDRAS